MLVSSGDKIKIWNAETSELLREFPSVSRILSFSIKSDNTQIAAICEGRGLSLFDLETSNETCLVESVEGKVPKCCAFAYDSVNTKRHLAVGFTNGEVEMLEFKLSQPIKRKPLFNCSQVINTLAWSKNDKFLAAGCSNGTVYIYNTILNQNGSCLLKPGSPAQVTCIQFMPKNANLACGYDDGSVIIWDVTVKGPPLSKVFNIHSMACTALAVTPNSLLIISGGLDRSIVIYDSHEKKIVAQISAGIEVTSLDLDSSGTKVSVGTVNGMILIYDIRGDLNSPVGSIQSHDCMVNSVHYFNGSSLSNKRALASLTNSQVSFSSVNSNSSINNTSKTTTASETAPFGSIYSPENQFIGRSLNPKLGSHLSGSNLLKNIETKKLSHYSSASQLINGSQTNMASSQLDITQPIQSTASITKRDIYSPLSSNTMPKPYIDEPMETQSPIMTIQTNISAATSTVSIPASDMMNTPKSVSTMVSMFKQQHFNIPKSKSDIPLSSVLTETENTEKTTVIEKENLTDSIVNELRDEIGDLREEMITEHFKFKMEMFKEFMSLKEELVKTIEKYSLNAELLEEIKLLREENARLKKLY